MSQRLYRGERLKSRKEIGRLFGRNARSANSYPIRAVFAEMDTAKSEFPVQVTFVVPKRRFKKAVDRNRIKRKMREAYRISKADHALSRVRGDGKQYAVLFMYTGKEEMEWAYLLRKMKVVLEKISGSV